MSEPRKLRVAIIGAGASGILALIKMREAGIHDVTVFEKADELGGTWRDNRYPGLTCDVPSHLYRYSFEPNPDWSHVCSPGPEILAYFKGVAEKYGLSEFIKYANEVTQAEFIDSRWHLDTVQGKQGALMRCWSRSAYCIIRSTPISRVLRGLPVRRFTRLVGRIRFP